MMINPQPVGRRLSKVHRFQLDRAGAWCGGPLAGLSTFNRGQKDPTKNHDPNPLPRTATSPFSFSCPPSANTLPPSSAMSLLSGPQRSRIVTPKNLVPSLHRSIPNVICRLPGCTLFSPDFLTLLLPSGISFTHDSGHLNRMNILV